MKFRGDPKLRFFPIGLIGIGILIHFGALIGLGASSTSGWIHFLLLIVDSVVGYYLIKRTHLGYWLAVVFFGEQVFFQSYGTIQSIRNDWNLWWAQGITVLFCLMSFMILIKNKRIFITLQSAETISSPTDD